MRVLQNNCYRAQGTHSFDTHWFFYCTALFVNLQDLLAIQMWASLVLLLGMIETGSQYFDYR